MPELTSIAKGTGNIIYKEQTYPIIHTKKKQTRTITTTITIIHITRMTIITRTTLTTRMTMGLTIITGMINTMAMDNTNDDTNFEPTLNSKI